MGDPKVHFVGSIPLQNSETVFRTLADRIGDAALTYPDGETGDRLTFVGWFRQKLGERAELEVAEQVSFELPFKGKVSLYRMKPGKRVADLPLRPLGYAAVAEASYGIFKRLRAAGEIPKQTRFQVCLPTPLILSQAIKAPLAERYPPFEQAMLAELSEILASIPAEDLAIQWDAPIETHGEEAARHPDRASRLSARDWTFEEGIEYLARICDAVPLGAKVGVHLCYGDINNRHIMEPFDMSVMVDTFNALAAKSSRAIDYVHMPVPIDRNDDMYFAPLDRLRLASTRLFLGLIHPKDGLSGAQAKVAAARRRVGSFGVGCECGLGRRDPASIPALLDLHRDVAELVT
jgi:hypothetical protein